MFGVGSRVLGLVFEVGSRTSVDNTTFRIPTEPQPPEKKRKQLKPSSLLGPFFLSLFLFAPGRCRQHKSLHRSLKTGGLIAHLGNRVPRLGKLSF